MTEKPCYKEDSLKDFAAWAKSCGHYPIETLEQNYQEYLRYVAKQEPPPQHKNTD